MILVVSVVAAVAAWYVFTIVRGLVRLRPQIETAAKKAHQDKQASLLADDDAGTLLMKAQRGDAAAQWNVGLMYAAGEGLPHDDGKAFAWFERAAQTGFVDAQYCLGLAYDCGRGVRRDVAKAHSWYEQAAKNGSTSAQCNIGVLYLQGEVGDEDWVTAAYWFLRAAAQKSDEAISNLKWIAEHGPSLPIAMRERLSQYRDLAVHGDIHAQFLVAWCFENGIGSLADSNQALSWYERAMEEGHLHAHDPVMRLRSLKEAGARRTAQ